MSGSIVPFVDRSPAETQRRPPYFLVNKFVLQEAADLVYDRSLDVVKRGGTSQLKVLKLEVGGAPCVAVVGDPPDRPVRRELARLFTIGVRANLTNEQLCELNDMT